MTAEVIQFDDNFALACECGSVKFCLLKSGKIECHKCQKQFGSWVEEITLEQPD